MKYTDKKGYNDYEVNELADHNIYKLGSRQLFCHVLSNMTHHDKEKIIPMGSILHDNTLSTQIISICGYEKTNEKEQWLTVPSEITC